MDKLETDFGVAFVSYKLGWLALTGKNDGLYRLDFLRPGSQPEQAGFKGPADQLGLLDEAGLLIEPPEGGPVNRALLAKDKQDYYLPGPVYEAASQVFDYLQGRRKVFDLPLKLEGASPFRKQVWQALLEIPYGSRVSYQELAASFAGSEAKARALARAVGGACGANPIPIIIPCHRVVGKNKSLTGFSGGLDIKEFLLDHELVK